jgi:sugar-specific transcriptional regulator TrmB
MQNHNVSEFSGDIKAAIKNGNFDSIILFPEITSDLTKFLDTFEDKKEISENQTLIKTRSPFRIGLIRINLLYFKNVLTKKVGYSFSKENFENLIQDLCKSHKNKIILSPFSNQFTQFRKEIETILEKNVRDTKIVVLN